MARKKMNLISFEEMMEKTYPDRAPLTETQKLDIAVKARIAVMRSGLSYAIKQARINDGISQVALSARTGIPQSEISRLENEQGNPTLETMAKLFEALGIRNRLIFKDSKPFDESLEELYARAADSASE